LTWLADIEIPQTTLANRWKRLGAFLIDQVIVIVGLTLGWLVRLAGSDVVSGAVFWVWFGAIGIVQIILLSTRGQSIGKMVVKVAIVDKTDKAPPGFVRAALIRQLPLMVINLFLPAWTLPCLLLDVLPIFGSARRCIHDRVAGTIVIDVLPDAPEPAS
jgi:uncharacterized RDD family membrane protein YckC